MWAWVPGEPGRGLRAGARLPLWTIVGSQAGNVNENRQGLGVGAACHTTESEGSLGTGAGAWRMRTKDVDQERPVDPAAGC